MPKICYRDWNPRGKSRALLVTVNQILSDYEAQGYDLTLRQTFYALVARDIIPNTQREYKNLGELIKNARYAGLIDWTRIVDRTRNVRSQSSWSYPGDIIHSAAESFHLNRWKDQKYHCEIFCEKDALIGIIGQVCERLDIPYFSCRGYASSSEVWRAAMRIRQKLDNQECVVLYLGDHDPSGVDMTRDIQDRFYTFGAGDCEVRRIALTMAQIEQYNPPPNPTKITDARAAKYIAKYGNESWELDALEPSVIEALIQEHAEEMIDQDVWNETEEKEEEGKGLLNRCARKWPRVVEFLIKNDEGSKKRGKVETGKRPGKAAKTKTAGKKATLKKAKRKGK